MALSDARLASKLETLADLTIFELRIEWRRHHKMPPPKRLSRDLLIRGIAFKLQERVLGGLSRSTLRKLEGLRSSEATAPAAASPSLRPGTKLIRDWGGETHSVLVLNSGFEWRGKTYRSLSTIARAITGAHWSGPRFFGLKRQSRSPRQSADVENVQD
ncbi:DUF2924 domain-containing protein [Hyphomicrobium sp. LHD-15]|uniref:DUF2924 domain-containing protein n=1 Tax=Hyphomicrobium sp. LHD-15 TaxID=3072142 RepID=UPI00280CBE69|nr:DUF2924 domain-containing protein [Hyphomicrobium sp. LHD-15]MDQ8699231.1 DUF2924 domain-containing protein [Hyphomicrobium sp. LHD-15]